MLQLCVNDRIYEVDEEKYKKLLPFLREELHLHSVKDGCSEGACGACSVLIDGKSVRACTQKIAKLEGKEIRTVEGLSDEEKTLYARAFSEAGAVQCGFCTPGMVISAKALLDRNGDPSEEEIKKAIRPNICRCTGYVKIVEAIRLAAFYKKEGVPEKEVHSWEVGDRVPRPDADEKTLGEAVFANDVEMDGMLYVGAVRTQYPRARVLSIDCSKAEALAGVAGIFTAEDVPGQNKTGHIIDDWDTLIPVGSETHCIGDGLVLIAAESEEILREAIASVEVQYEVLEPVHGIEEAMREDAPQIHAGGNLASHHHVKRGDPDTILALAPYVMTGVFETPFTEHAFLEPESAVAFMENDGSMHLYTSDQGVYLVRAELAKLLDWPEEKIWVENVYVGGAFGGKEDATVQKLAALACYHLKRPCKATLTRQESIYLHPKRHAMKVMLTVGCDMEGVIVGAKLRVDSDTGAYASVASPVLERACTHGSGPYKYQNYEAEGFAWYTNNPPGGAFRGFGVPQTCYAMEMMLDQLAKKVGISDWEIRYRNAVRPGDALPNGQITDGSTALIETLEAVRDEYDAHPGAGIACSMKNSGLGVGVEDIGRVLLKIIDGKVHIRSGASCIGQGLGTVLKQVAVEYTKLDPDLFVYDKSNSHIAPDSGESSASRHTTITGEACRRAAVKLAEALGEKPNLTDHEGEEFFGEYVTETDPLNSPKPNPVSHVAYGYATQLCILGEDGKIEKLTAAHAVGRAINPLSLEGQIEGGLIMSMGYTLTEDFPLKDCVPTASFGRLGLLRADQIPEVETIIIEKEGSQVPLGAIGVGEITSIPTVPAIAAAYYHKDGKLRRSLPLEDTPYSKKK